MDEKQPLLKLADRNVVILGKVGTGKRTLGNHIIGTDVFHPGEHSADTKCHYEEWQSVQNILYRILIVHIRRACRLII